MSGLLTLPFAGEAPTDTGDGLNGQRIWDGGGMFMGLGMIANFLVAVVVITVFLVKNLSGDSQPSSTTSTAMDVVN